VEWSSPDSGLYQERLPQLIDKPLPTLRKIDRMKTKTLLFNLSGHGHFDMSAYGRYLKGELEDFDYPEAAIKES
jgi:hypothetical protein